MLATLAVTGQIAWAVENSWFNTFVYDMLTPDPRPVAWMVAASAIMATLTTLLMGTLSDRTRSRVGRRKPYIEVEKMDFERVREAHEDLVILARIGFGQGTLEQIADVYLFSPAVQVSQVEVARLDL